jgi:hypothetical protein
MLTNVQKWLKGLVAQESLREGNDGAGKLLFSQQGWYISAGTQPAAGRKSSQRGVANFQTEMPSICD